ncbi:ephrin type-B receptor 1-B isoform X6 [Cloeon dipterum]|uniref:ephrin type-B receptor 1-B isoform X6 n=1 Tax=Cloeon dipterum TaxID=197152 RepID=UPI00321F879D
MAVWIEARCSVLIVARERERRKRGAPSAASREPPRQRRDHRLRLILALHVESSARQRRAAASLFLPSVHAGSCEGESSPRTASAEHKFVASCASRVRPRQCDYGYSLRNFIEAAWLFVVSASTFASELPAITRGRAKRKNVSRGAPLNLEEMQTEETYRPRRTPVIQPPPTRKMALVIKTCIVSTLLLVLFARQTAAEKVMLYDTKNSTNSLGWKTHRTVGSGFLEESEYRSEEGYRAYTACDYMVEGVDNWLMMPLIKRGEANRIYINTLFSIRDCSSLSNAVRTCKETASVYYHEMSGETGSTLPDDRESYKFLGKLVTKTFSASESVADTNTTQSIPASEHGVFFAFKDEGTCITLLSVQVFYLRCPEVTANLTHFPATATGRSSSDFVMATGECVANAEAVDPYGVKSQTIPQSWCKPDGKWFSVESVVNCKCKPGYEPDANNVSCKVSPTAPQNLTVTAVDQSSISLTWQPPQSQGGRTDTYYSIVCDVCSDSATVEPNLDNFRETYVTISGLQPMTSYGIKVFARNGVSEQSTDKTAYADIMVSTTASVPSSVSNVRVTSIKSTEVTLAWDSPEDYPRDVEMFEVRYFIKGPNNVQHSALSNDTFKLLTGLRQKTEYGFQVRTKTKSGWGELSPPIYKTTGQVLNPAFVVEEEDNVQMRIVAGAIVGTVVVVVLVIVLVVLFFRSRGSDDCNKKQPSDCDTLEYRNGEVHCNLDSPPIVTTHTNGMTTPLFTQVGASRTYIDPHTYEDPNQAVREFAREIDASCITIEAIIGGGEFGDVCRGKLRLAGRAEADVAIKTLKPGSSNKARMDFLTEASIMGQFEHPNVIFLQGVVTKSNPVMIITEYMENGSLDTFLRANDGQFQVLQLAGMLRGIAAGMQYLSEMNYVHRDLAARNVLVNAQLVCKIADFGLSREIESTTEGAYTTRGGKIPVRWTAPEAIAFRKFTSASDVWSFGIVCWEVMSYGERPYWNWSNQDVIKSIEKGYRLPAPMDCPEAVYQLMLDCWQKERTHRPTFASIVKTLDKLIRCPDTLRKIAQNRNANPLSANAPDLTQFTSVEEWLSSIKMARYTDNFQRAGICSIDAVVRLTVKELTALGITLVGHQKKIMNSVQAMRAQIQANLSEGFLV